MATSPFLSRWSKRKLEEPSSYLDEESASNETEVASEKTASDEASAELKSQSLEASTEQTTEEEKPEKMPIASLLVSEASESVKKAALRKLFLSEEYNVRDGLDEYDEDYSNLKTLSEGVAETLRDWINEETTTEPESPLAESEPALEDSSIAEQDRGESPQENNAGNEKKVADKSATLDTDAMTERIGQNIPQSK